MKHAQKMLMVSEQLLQSMENRTSIDYSRSAYNSDTLRSRYETNHGFVFTRRSKSPHIGSTSTEVSRVDETDEE